jgi:hypothetical protein
MYKAWDAVVRNRLALLFVALITSQLLTWRAVVAVEDRVDDVRIAVRSVACGTYGDPCRVIVMGR